ncbi:MAG: tRNA (guanine(26)-N(2))-dimethyltransferase [Desulfurococcales archaeon]|nr:tRNA (guanine(26)-N(2))-dimethyltransferase [Desulfurococcales archaeon]
MQCRSPAPQAVVREGRALLYIDGIDEAIQPDGRLEPTWMRVFYNPAMTLNRDLSVVFLNYYASTTGRRLTIVDPLTATGVRAVRYALEVRGVGYVIAGDVDPRAVCIARLNTELNNVAYATTVVESDARSLLYEAKHTGIPMHYVDIDPFGSPAPFTEAALEAVGRGGIAAFTATDVAVLGGSKSRAAARRYLVTIGRLRQYQEVALRVLLGYIARVAASVDKRIEPLLSYSERHYVRVYVRIDRGARKADSMLDEMLGYMYECSDGTVSFSKDDCSSVVRAHGPLWTGKLIEENVAGSLQALVEDARMGYLQSREDLLRLLDVIQGESGLSMYPAQSIEHVAARLRVSMPSRRKIIDSLVEEGYEASRVHFSPTGIRTNAPPSVLASIIKRLSPGP